MERIGSRAVGTIDGVPEVNRQARDVAEIVILQLSC